MKTFLASGPFWLGTAERAVKTAAQSGIAVLTTNVTGILDVDWAEGLSVVGLATLVSVLTSILSGGVSPAGSPSLVADRPADEPNGPARPPAP